MVMVEAAAVAAAEHLVAVAELLAQTDLTHLVVVMVAAVVMIRIEL